MNDKKMKPTTGFTLAELLVALAILLILAAILFPVFASAREKARQNACSSNERQLGIALLSYAQDNDETLPAGNAPASSANPAGWAGPLFPYVQSVGIFQCPDDPTAPMPSYVRQKIQYAYYPDSFGYNVNLAALPLVAKLSAPARTVMLFEVSAAIVDLQMSLETDSSMGDGLGSITPGTIHPPGPNGIFDAPLYATGTFAGPDRPIGCRAEPPR